MPEHEDVGRKTRCVACGEEMRELHCKLVCPKCGAMIDCGD